MPSHFFVFLHWGSDGFHRIIQDLGSFETYWESESDLLYALSSNFCARHNFSVLLTPVGSSLRGNQV